jgi:regulator of protease activity HflC (stomatin/prohibitin superfamily)
VLALYHILGTVFTIDGSIIWWGWDFGTSLKDPKWNMATHPGPVMAVVGGVGFLAFLLSRYTAGMARVPGWRMLRAGASYLAGNALACLLVIIAIGLQGRDLPNPEAIVAYAIRIAMLVLGIEFTINFILDFYRPRQTGQESRPAFDSRLLALITEPGGIARSLADAINYQFGFEVSSTWFYQLLKKAMLPMIAFGLLVLLALSTVAIVDSDEQVVIERFGRRLQEPGQALGPGLHLKAPWPVDIAYRARVEQVRMLTVGDVPKEDEFEVGPDGTRRPKPILWGQKHEFNKEMMLVLASRELTNFNVPVSENQNTGKAVAVGLLMVSVDIQYCVDDVFAYLYAYQNPEAMVEAVAYEVLTEYAAGVDFDQFLGTGRSKVNEILRTKLNEQMEKLGLGIRILFVGLQEAHPNDTVARAFQDVVKAEREKDNAIANARGMAEEILTEAAGSSARAMILDEAIRARDQLAADRNASPEALKEAEARVALLLEGSVQDNLPPTGGEAATRLAHARAEMLRQLTETRRAQALFAAERIGYEAAPQLYRTRKYLEMLQNAVQNVRKYVVLPGPDTKVITIYEKPERGTIDVETTSPGR